MRLVHKANYLPQSQFHKLPITDLYLSIKSSRQDKTHIQYRCFLSFLFLFNHFNQTIFNYIYPCITARCDSEESPVKCSHLLEKHFNSEADNFFSLFYHEHSALEDLHIAKSLLFASKFFETKSFKPLQKGCVLPL